MTDDKSADLRSRPIVLKWDGNCIGRLTIGGKHWASVEWSEKRQRWCVEDSEGRCLTHRPSIHGMAASSGRSGRARQGHDPRRTNAEPSGC